MTKTITRIICPISLLMVVLLLSRPASAFDSVKWLTAERLDRLLDSAVVEAPKLVTYLIFLGLGWLVGKRLTVLWSRQQKSNEQDLDAVREFHALYGEFFALWKLWNYYLHDLGPQALPGASRWELLDRACKSEAKLEATLVRLASHKLLTDGEVVILGRFRQHYQMMRAAIRDNVPLGWDHSEHPDYIEFKKLAPQVAAIIVGDKVVDKDLLARITSNIYELPQGRRGKEQSHASQSVSSTVT